VASATSVTVTSPAHAAGAVDVTITTPGGTSTAVTGDKFTYAAAPPACTTPESAFTGTVGLGAGRALTVSFTRIVLPLNLGSFWEGYATYDGPAATGAGRVHIITLIITPSPVVVALTDVCGVGFTLPAFDTDSFQSGTLSVRVTQPVAGGPQSVDLSYLALKVSSVATGQLVLR
jgi:hypothetical protein